MKSQKGHVLYARITKTNKKWLAKEAGNKGISISDYVNLIINDLREPKQEDTHNEDSYQASFR